MQAPSRALAVRPYSEFCVIDPSQLSSALGVNFKPGGASALFGISAPELHNRSVSLETFWGHLAEDMRDHLLESREVARKFQVLEGYLLVWLSRSTATHPFVAHAVREFQIVPHARTIATVASQIGCSQARFIDVFKNAVGMTPTGFVAFSAFNMPYDS
jgi:hypothetical protein